jgi:hypothetical protein
MNPLVVIFVAAGVLGVLVWLIASAVRASSQRGPSDSSSSGGDSGSWFSHSSHSFDSSSSDSGGDSGGAVTVVEAIELGRARQRYLRE